MENWTVQELSPKHFGGSIGEDFGPGAPVDSCVQSTEVGLSVDNPYSCQDLQLVQYLQHFRDIPMPLVSSGVEHGNIRELALARMKDLGTTCRDVRTREVGIQEIHNKVKPYEVSNR